MYLFYFFETQSKVYSFFFFFSSRRRHTRFSRDWSSDVCSSDLGDSPRVGRRADGVRCKREGDDLRPLGQLPLEIVEVERRVVVDVDDAHDESEVVRNLEPR